MDALIEQERLAALDRFEVLDTPQEPLFDSLTELAAQTFSVPIALISLVDRKRQWFKACIGLDVDHTAREISFCRHAIGSDDVFVVQDATVDERFSSNPLVIGPPAIRFYAGAPLITEDGHRLGTLCIIDTDPRVFSRADASRLQAIAKSVMQALTLRFESRERERIAVLAAERAELLKQAEEMGGVGTWSWDAVADRTTWSDQVYRIHGYEPAVEPPPLQGVLERYHPEDAKLLSNHVQVAVAEGRDYALSARIYRPDGEERHVIARGACRRDATGAVTGLVGTFQDVTDHVSAERFIRTLTDNLPGLVAYWDKDLRCRFANAAYEDWFDRSSDDMRNLTLPSLLGPDLYAKNENCIVSALAGQRQSFPQSIIKPCGQVGHVLTHYIPDIDTAGRIRGFYVLASDVTELAEARYQAESAARSKANFLSNMSHEIRTPLNGVIGFADILQATPLSDDQSSYVQRITSASRSLLEIVNDVLDFSKIDAGQMKVEMRPFDLRTLIEEVVSLISAARPNPRLKISYEVATDVAPLVVADETRVRQVLTNILGNAAKFTEAGHVRLDARLRAGRLCIVVADTGPGIPADKLEHIFSEFSQADSSITRRFGGTGLGLSISRSLAQLMNGDLTLVSTPGEGTNAILTLPYFTERRLKAVDRVQRKQDRRAPAGARIMVVDDVEMNRALVEVGLSARGHQVTSFSSAPDAIQALLEGAVFDVILMDVQMPEMDGMTATRHIREMPCPAARIPIVALTANALDSQAVDCRAAGMDAHFPKPVDMHSLNGLIARLINQKNEEDTRRAAQAAVAIEALKEDCRKDILELPGKLGALLRIQDPDMRVRAIAALAHSVAGTAGNFGFAAISDAGFRLEAVTKEIIAGSLARDSLHDAVGRFIGIAEQQAA